MLSGGVYGVVKDVGTSGRDFYESLYASELEQEAEWLRRGAVYKADSLEALLKPHSISAQSILELTHVIEHLDNPHAFLTGTLQKLQFKYIIAEVPLKDLAAGRLKNLVRDRPINTSRHVQFFASSFERPLTAHGLKIIDRYRYARFYYSHDSITHTMQFCVCGATPHRPLQC
jgi:hypothetical protein